MWRVILHSRPPRAAEFAHLAALSACLRGPQQFRPLHNRLLLFWTYVLSNAVNQHTAPALVRPYSCTRPQPSSQTWRCLLATRLDPDRQQALTNERKQQHWREMDTPSIRAAARNRHSRHRSCTGSFCMPACNLGNGEPEGLPHKTGIQLANNIDAVDLLELQLAVI